MDFLISLSEPEKEKLAGINKKNASVMYQDQTLSKEDVCATIPKIPPPSPWCPY